MGEHIVWCCWDSCRKPHTVEGAVPVRCPECKRIGRWTTTPPYRLSEMDRRFLKSIHVEPTEVTK